MEACKDKLLCAAESFAKVWFQQSMCAVNKGSEEAAICCCSVLRDFVGEMGDSNNLQGSSK